MGGGDDLDHRGVTWHWVVVPNATQTRSGTGGEALPGPARIFQVTVVAGPSLAEAKVVTLDQRGLTLGRDPSGSSRCLSLADEQASRNHAEIPYDPVAERYAIRDLRSRNGVFVGGRRTESAPLTHGAVVRVGSTLFVCSDRLLGPDDPLAGESPALRGISLAMERVRGDIARVASHPMPVLVLGESGTGKDLVARELHRLSGRAGPFVAVNCAAIPEALAENELFGHTAGAFTGATQRSDGYFASAEGGTLFLDEVAELPAGVQAKLLRALGTGEVRALGRGDARRVDVRVVAATNRDVSAVGDFAQICSRASPDGRCAFPLCAIGARTSSGSRASSPSGSPRTHRYRRTRPRRSSSTTGRAMSASWR